MDTLSQPVPIPPNYIVEGGEQVRMREDTQFYATIDPVQSQPMPFPPTPPLEPVKETKKSHDKINLYDRVILTTEKYGCNSDRPIWGKHSSNVVGCVMDKSSYYHIHWENNYELNVYDGEIELYKNQKRGIVPGVYGIPTDEKLVTFKKGMNEEMRLIGCDKEHSGGIFFGCGNTKDKVHIDTVIKIPRCGGCDDLNGMNPEEQDMMLKTIKGCGLKYIALIIVRVILPLTTDYKATQYLLNYTQVKTDIPLIVITPACTIGWIYDEKLGSTKRFLIA